MTILKKKVNVWPYLLILPALIVVILVIFLPIGKAMLMSFQSYDLRRPSDIHFIGLNNYIQVFKDPIFWLSFKRTIEWVIFGVGFQFVFGFLLALLLNKEFKGRGIVRSVSLIPWVTPGVLIALMWRWIYDGTYGILNDILLRLGFLHKKIPFLAYLDTAFPATVVAIIWQGIPFFAIMLLAGLQQIPQELYEAADIDGANVVQKFFKITIPSLKNTILVTTLLRIIWVANSVDVIVNMTGGGPAYSSQTLSVYIFNTTTSLNLGYSSTMAILLTLMLLVVAIPYLKLMFKDEEG